MIKKFVSRYIRMTSANIDVILQVEGWLRRAYASGSEVAMQGAWFWTKLVIILFRMESVGDALRRNGRLKPLTLISLHWTGSCGESEINLSKEWMIILICMSFWLYNLITRLCIVRFLISQNENLCIIILLIWMAYIQKVFISLWNIWNLNKFTIF